MCLAIPAQIVELESNEMAKVRVGNGNTFITASLMLLPEPAKRGDYVIVHAGFALHILPPQEAENTLAALREFAACAVATGTDSI